MIPKLTCFLPKTNIAMFLQIVLEIIIELSEGKQKSAIKTAARMVEVLACIALDILLLLDHLIKMSAME